MKSTITDETLRLYRSRGLTALQAREILSRVGWSPREISDMLRATNTPPLTLLERLRNLFRRTP